MFTSLTQGPYCTIVYSVPENNFLKSYKQTVSRLHMLFAHDQLTSTQSIPILFWTPCAMLLNVLSNH